MDAIQLIEKDHREVERLFEQFERFTRNEDRREQLRLVREMVRELSLHAAVEEEVLYPALQRLGVEAERFDALEEHHAVKVTLAEIEALSPADPRFVAKVRLVAKNVRRHAQEEEAALLPRLRELEDDGLRRLGTELAEARRSAPTRPHPAAPDTPPGNILANAGAALVDRWRDALLDAAQLLRSMFKQGAKQGFRVARETALRVRREGEATVEQARERGEGALEEMRAQGRRVVGAAQEQGAELVGRLEHRAALASREIGRSAAAAGARARAGQRKRRRNGRAAAARPKVRPARRARPGRREG